eukprot:TRINITY_DN1926_c0_g1_i1.p2 TRINITY_DN1926_c0_g1~~TRINITY_DN1926_c0_g1_i1.p2  ORF type:complete len:104 (+),score=3.06 TRINITY_DN1926_c0_g1_i1:80-391(+)
MFRPQSRCHRIQHANVTFPLPLQLEQVKPLLELCQSQPEPPQMLQPWSLQPFCFSSTVVPGQRQVEHFQPLRLELMNRMRHSLQAFLSHMKQDVSYSMSLSHQ